MRRTLDALLAVPGLTRARFAGLTLVSLVATAVVLAAGGGRDRTPWPLVAAAAQRPAPLVEVTPRAPAPAAAPADTTEPTPAPPAESSAPADTRAASQASDPRVPASNPKPKAQPAPAAPAPATPVSKIKHVFVVSLAGAGYDATWGPGSQAVYLTGTLRPQGRLLEGYRPLAAGDLATQVALLSGQKPTPGVQHGCPTYGGDCLFPLETLTLADQLVSRGQRWRGYFEGMPQPCTHPAVNAADAPSGEYTTTHNPFVYFRSLTDLGECGTNDLPLDALPGDLGSARATPNYVFVAPGLCDGGWSATCSDGTPGGLARADTFLAEWVPKILDSPAYKADGLLIVLFGAPAGADPPDANTGALLVSQFATPGSTSTASYDAYGVLRSVEDLFGLDYLAAAGETAASSFAKTEVAAGLG
jgi:hypothetical protein